MASAVPASQNETSWARMGKIPYSAPYLNPNPKPNPKKRQKQLHHAARNGGVASRYNNIDSPAVTQTASDDAYSFNQASTSRDAANYGSYLTFNVSDYTKAEILELRKRLRAELQQIQDLQDRIVSGQLSNSGNPRPHQKVKKDSASKRPVSAFGSIPSKPIKGFGNRNSNSVNFEPLLKECRQIVGKLIKHKYGYVFKTPVDAVAFGLHDYHHIVKQPMDLGTVKSNLSKNLYATPAEFAADVRLTFNNALLYNPKTDPVHSMAEQMLLRFEELFRPIQGKIDGYFRDRVFQESRADEIQFEGNAELQGSSWNHNDHGPGVLSPARVKNAVKKGSPRNPERIHMPAQAHSSASTPNHPPSPVNHQPVPVQVQVQEQEQEQAQLPSPSQGVPVKEHKVGRGGGGPVKQPKPRAKDPNKREMTMEEKHKLGLGLQNLPQEKMPQLIQIIRKRNDHLAQDDDEIELDIESLDTETLWELDRFVTNWKKFVSKTRRQALINTSAVVAPLTPNHEADMGMSDKKDDSVKRLKDNDEEDVEIDDDMPVTSFPPVEIERDEGAGFGGGGGGGGDGADQGHERDHEDRGKASSSSSSSGGSSSDTSSSSDSDTGSSSGSESDADDAQS